jgi:hypothetical protein
MCNRASEPTPPANPSATILLSISDSEYGLFRPHLEYVELPDHLVLHEAGESWSLCTRIEG